MFLVFFCVPDTAATRGQSLEQGLMILWRITAYSVFVGHVAQVVTNKLIHGLIN